jgi:4-coumarate--CoA ligase (photoactive yellow protein activation family)
MPHEWWTHDEALRRFVTDLISHELTRSRRGGFLPPRPWDLSLSLTEGDLCCDSLELLSLAAALGQSLHLHSSGIEDALLARRTVGDWVDIGRLGLERYSAEVSFLTSGSTSAPKRCDHSVRELQQEIEALAKIFPSTKRIIAAVPSHHIYGFLFTQMLPAGLALPVCDLTGRSTIQLEGLARPGDLIVGHPDFWRLVATSSALFPDEVVGVTSTAPFPADLAPILRAKNLHRLVEIYGSTETAGVGWRQSSAEPFSLFEHWIQTGQSTTLMRRSPDGSTRSVELQDSLTWESPTTFRVGSRHDLAFQVGGVNVHPDRIVAVLEAHPKVARAQVRLMQPTEGNRVKAFIVPARPDLDLAEMRRELDLWTAATLTAPERPRAFTFGSALPAGPLGKAIDWALD